MATIRKEIALDARPDDVWAALRDFHAVHERLAPGFVTESRPDGDARIVTFANGAVASGGLGALFPAEVEDEGTEDVVAFVPVRSAPRLGEASLAAGVRVGELPATDVAVVVHHGSFESMIDTYRNLGAWVATNAAPAGMPVREYYLDEVRTEICWPVH